VKSAGAKPGETMKNQQRRVAEFVARNGLETDVAHRLLDAVSELGEVAKEVLKGTRYGATRFAATKAWQEELGDVVFSLMCVANTTGVDLSDAVDRVLRKYKRRLKERGTASSPGGTRRARVVTRRGRGK